MTRAATSPRQAKPNGAAESHPGDAIDPRLRAWIARSKDKAKVSDACKQTGEFRYPHSMSLSACTGGSAVDDCEAGWRANPLLGTRGRVAQHRAEHRVARTQPANLLSAILPGTGGISGRLAMDAREVRCACLLYTSPSPRDRTRSRM